MTHFGAIPETYKFRSSLRYDVFHGRGNVIKIFLVHIRKLLELNYDAVEKFAHILYEMDGWGAYEVSPWVTQDALSRLQGKHTKAFTREIPNVINLLKELLPSHLINDFNTSLLAFYYMSKCLNYVIIDDFEKVKHLFPESECKRLRYEVQEKSALLYYIMHL